MASLTEQHKKIERNVTLLAVFAFLAVIIGGIVEIAPLFWIDNTVEKVDGMRPYTPLEQYGRDIYVREGCYLCHSQMIRPFRDETERYGHYSLEPFFLPLMHVQNVGLFYHTAQKYTNTYTITINQQLSHSPTQPNSHM